MGKTLGGVINGHRQTQRHNEQHALVVIQQMANYPPSRVKEPNLRAVSFRNISGRGTSLDVGALQSFRMNLLTVWGGGGGV